MGLFLFGPICRSANYRVFELFQELLTVSNWVKAEIMQDKKAITLQNNTCQI